MVNLENILTPNNITTVLKESNSGKNGSYTNRGEVRDGLITH